MHIAMKETRQTKNVLIHNISMTNTHDAQRKGISSFLVRDSNLHNQQFDGHFLLLRRNYNEPFNDVTKLLHLKEN
jgi:hypothetical protein